MVYTKGGETLIQGVGEYAGSIVLDDGECFPAASSVERISCLRTAEYSPDIILVYIGSFALNDLHRHV